MGLTGSFNITFPQPQFCLMAWWSGKKKHNWALDLASLGSSNRSKEVNKQLQLYNMGRTCIIQNLHKLYQANIGFGFFFTEYIYGLYSCREKCENM